MNLAVLVNQCIGKMSKQPSDAFGGIQNPSIVGDAKCQNKAIHSLKHQVNKFVIA